MSHKLYLKLKFLEKLVPKTFLEEKKLLNALNFSDIKMLDKEYIIVSFFFWISSFFILLFLYLVYFLIFGSLSLYFVAYTQLLLAFFTLFIYYYPFILSKIKINKIEEEFTMFFLHFKILVESGLNFNNIVTYIVTQDNLPYPTIKKEFERIFNYSKLENTSIEKAFSKIVLQYPESFVKNILIELINYQRENEDLSKFAKKTWEKIEKKNEIEENKFYNKLDFIMDFYSIVLLIFPFLIILTTFIFDSVNFVLEKIMNDSFNLGRSIFYRTILFLLIFLPFFYLLVLLVVDNIIPKHLKYLRKLKNYYFKK